MYGSHQLPPPSSFTNDSRPLRLTSNTPPPLPTGECRFILLHPSIQDRRCSCQNFHRNVGVPGSICDCGHQGCYHVHTQASSLADPKTQNKYTPLATYTALSDRVKKLEEALKIERRTRDAAIEEERRTRDREIRILREALHPFYRSEEEMRRRLVDLEDRIEGNYDEYLRLKDRVIAVDDATMSLEKRVEEMPGSKPKRRRVSRQIGNEASSENNPNAFRGGSAVSSPTEMASAGASSSRAISPTGPRAYAIEDDEPRSSGILDLVNFSAPPPYAPLPMIHSPREEARSSGFLEFSLASRLASKVTPHPPRDFASSGESIQAQGPPCHSPYDQKAPLNIVSLLARSDIMATDKINQVHVAEVNGDSSPKKRKRCNEMMALDVLANVSAASSMAERI